VDRADSNNASANEDVRRFSSGPIVVVINSAAGPELDLERMSSIAEVFASYGKEVSFSIVGSGVEAFGIARSALESGAQMIVCGGGDGTIGAVASLLAGKECVLGVLPLGTLNHFAKDLRMPMDLEEAARVICEGRVARIDTAAVNGRVYINNSSIGLYPRIVRRRRQLQERLGSGRWSAFFWALLDALRRYPFVRVRLTTDVNEIIRETPFVFVGNNEYELQRWQLVGRARLDGGLLSLYVTHRKGRLGLLWLAVRALFGRVREAKDFDALKAKEIWVETHRPKRLPVAVDGEVTLMRTPLHYQAQPGSLKVIVPRES
jgi:diacylglycerol kinase family enzyme